MRIEEKFVLITGSARRVGAELARAFAAAGARLLLHCRNSRVEAEALVNMLPGGAARHRVLQADLARPGEALRLFSEAGRVDILINNASMYRLAPLADAPEALDREHFEVNFWSPLALMKAFAAQPDLNEGAVVNLLDQEISGISPRGGGYALPPGSRGGDAGTRPRTRPPESPFQRRRPRSGPAAGRAGAFEDGEDAPHPAAPAQGGA